MKIGHLLLGLKVKNKYNQNLRNTAVKHFCTGSYFTIVSCLGKRDTNLYFD